MPIDTSTAAATGEQPPSRLSFDEGVALLAKGNEASAATQDKPAALPPSDAEPPAVESDPKDTDDESPLSPDDGDKSEEPELGESEETGFVELDDGSKITSEEARKGYLRNKDYTEKTQKLADRLREVNSHEELVSKGAQYLLERLPQIKSVLESRIPSEPDTSLRQTDPLKYWDQYNERQSIMAQVQKADAEAAQAKQYLAQLEHRKETERYHEEGEKLLERLPSWKNPKVAKVEKAEVSKYAKSLGYTAEDIAKFDHRMVVALRDGAIGKKVREGGSKAKVQREPQPVGSEQTRPSGSSSLSRQQTELRGAAMNGSRRERFEAGAALLQRRG